jgi:hypothetical protein
MSGQSWSSTYSGLQNMMELRIIRILLAGNFKRFRTAAIRGGQSFGETGKRNAFFQLLFNADDTWCAGCHGGYIAVCGFADRLRCDRQICFHITQALKVRIHGLDFSGRVVVALFFLSIQGTAIIRRLRHDVRE